MTRTLVLLLSLALAWPAIAVPASADGLSVFPDGTRYGAIGDSITHGGRYPLYLELFYLTRFPKESIDVINCGISGDTAKGGKDRFPWDIAPHHLQVASIMFGMNDVGRDLYAPNATRADLQAQRQSRIDNWETNLRALIGLLKNDGTQVILLTPSIYDETSTMPAVNDKGVNEALGECAKRAAAISTELGTSVIDFYGPMNAVNQRLQAANPAATITGPDRVHPRAPGHLVMFYQFLKAQNAPPEVDHVAINGADGTVAKADNCSVTDAKVGLGNLGFTVTANALPFPVEDAAHPALDWVSFTDDFNREILQVTGLTVGSKYALLIDGAAAGVYSAADLQSGVNLAVESGTPEYHQAQDVLKLVIQRWDLIHKLRDLAMVEQRVPGNVPRPLALEQVAALLPARLAEAHGQPWEPTIRRTGEDYLVSKPHESEIAAQAEALLTQARQLAQPKPHRFEIKPAPAAAQ